MELRFDEEQVALRDAIGAFCRDQADPANIAATEARLAESQPRLWAGLAEMGVFGLLVPADRGGFGGGAVEAAIVFEQLGAHLVPGPLLWSTIAAPLVPDVHTGAIRVAGLVADGPTGSRVVIEHAAECDVVVIVHDDRVERCDAAALPDGTAGEPLDPLTPATLYPVVPKGDVIGSAEDAQRLRLVGTVLTASMLVGVAQGALDVAKAYALERHQFGVPIGSFQAVKHLLADMYVRTELARSAAYTAAAVLDEQAVSSGGVAKAAATAKLLAGEAGMTNGRTAVQVLGGMGFTWEMLPHYFLKRAWVLEFAFGTGDAHTLALGDALGSEVAAGVTTWT